MDPGAADGVRARRLVGNAAVSVAMAESVPAGWVGQMLLGGQDRIGNQAVAKVIAGQPGPTPFVPGAPARVAPGDSRKPASGRPDLPKAAAPPATLPSQKDLAREPTAEKPGKGAKKEETTGPRSPAADPKFQALKKDVAAKKNRIAASHPPPATEAGAAQAASVPPADDREARGKVAHAEDMDAAQPKEFDKAAFVAAVEDAIAKRAPKNLDEADKFGESGKAEEVKAEVQGKVGDGKEASARDIADTTAAVPQPAPDAKQVVPLAPDQVPGKPGAPNADQAVPDRLPASATDMSAGPAEVNQQMADAQVTEPQLKKSNEPTFNAALRDKKTADQHAETAPDRLRKREAGELQQVKATAATKGVSAVAGMHATRVTAGKHVGDGKQGAKTRDEDKRAQVTTLLQKVFDRTKDDVDKILSNVDKMVDRQFTVGEKAARDRFTAEHTDGMNRYKDERYSGVIGKARWVRDLFADLPEEANRIYERAKDHYLTAMRQVITDIAGTIDRELHRAKDRIAAGRTELKDAVDRLPVDLRGIGRDAAAEFAGRFDELRDTVEDKGTELVDTLATKYVDAVKSVDEEIAAEKEKNKGLVSKAADAIGGVIRTIKELGSLLMGVLRKAATAIGAILRDPIGFLGNLVTGVGGGLKLFARNAGRHLEAGVLAWLLGVGVTGLVLPTTFDIVGILMMVALLLGLSWANIRARLARRVPERAVVAAEFSVPVVAAMKKRGVIGMWDELRPRVGDLKKDLVGNLVSFLLPTIILAGITLIVSLFNPASAFIRACKMIIDIVRFIVTQARQIIEFVNAVLDAVIAIAGGSTGAAAALVERALAKSIPVLIGALAAILGIGGIAEKVKQIVQKLARPVNRAIDWVIDKTIALIKKLWDKIKPKKARPVGRPGMPRVPRRPRVPGQKVRRRPDRGRKPDRGPDRRKKDERSQQRELMAALREAGRLADRTGDEDAVRRGLPAIRARHHLTMLTVSVRPGTGDRDLFVFDGAINPRARFEDLVLNKYLRDAEKAFKATGRVFAIRDMPGEFGETVPGLARVLGLGETQARKYAEEWVGQHRLTKPPPTSRGRVVYSFVRLTETDLRVPFDHPERERWMQGAAEIKIREARGSRLWYLAVAGLRDRRPDYFVVVADSLLEHMHIHPGRGALWSGGIDLSRYAADLGFTTLEKQEFYTVTEGIVFLDGMKATEGVWKAFSEKYARQLRKEVHIFVRRLYDGTVLVDVELPAVAEMARKLNRPIPLKFHGLEWGDDPGKILDDAVPDYWRELTPDGDALMKGQQQILNRGEAEVATQRAEKRFRDKQKNKLRR